MTDGIRTRISQYVVDQVRPEVPPLPANPSTIVPGWPDPRLSVPKGMQVSPGDTVTVPVVLEQTEPRGRPIAPETLDLAVGYDPAVLDVVAVHPGVLVPGLNVAWSGDAAVLPAGVAGGLLLIDFAARPGAAPGWTTW